MSPLISEISKLYVFAQGCPPQSSCGGGVESVVNVTLDECAMACIVSKPRGAQQTNMQKPQNRLALNRQLCKRPEHQKVASDATNLSGCKPLDDNHALATTGENTCESTCSHSARAVILSHIGQIRKISLTTGSFPGNFSKTPCKAPLHSQLVGRQIENSISETILHTLSSFPSIS